MLISKTNKRRAAKAFLFVLGYITTIIGALIANYLWLYLQSEEGKVMTTHYLTSVAAYIPYVGWSVFALLLLLQFYVGFWAGKKRSKLGNQEAIEKIERDHEAVLKFRHDEYEESKKQIHLVHVAPLKAMLEANKWLIDKAALQAQHIEEYVTLERFFFCHIPQANPERIIFALKVRNNSLFDIQLELANDTGRISFDTLILKGSKFLSKPKLSPTDAFRITLEQRLETGDKQLIENWETANPGIWKEHCFNIDRLKIKINCLDETMGVVEKELIIRKGFLVNDADRYDKSKEDFR